MSGGKLLVALLLHVHTRMVANTGRNSSGALCHVSMCVDLKDLEPGLHTHSKLNLAAVPRPVP